MSTQVIDEVDELVEAAEGQTEDVDRIIEVSTPEHVDKPERVTRFGWCQTKHHGYAPGITVEPGLCPGVTAGSKGYPSMTCGCECHQGAEPTFRARPSDRMRHFGVDDIEEGDPGQDTEDQAASQSEPQ